MRITIVGGAGVVGSKIANLLTRGGHHVVIASRRTGVDVISGRGLGRAVDGADAVIDVVNAPSFDGDDPVRFFETSTRNVLAEAKRAGIQHHISLSIVGAERLTANGYFRAKLHQEQLVGASSVPHTLIRATQFFEFIDQIIMTSSAGGEIHVAPARVQPIAAADVAAAIAAIVGFPASNDIIELAGPDFFRLDQLLRYYLTATGDTREVITDEDALYFGTRLTDETLVAGENPRFGHTDFDAWIRMRLRTTAPSSKGSNQDHRSSTSG